MHYYPEGAVQRADQIPVGEVVYIGWSYRRKPQEYVTVGPAEVSKYGFDVVPAFTTSDTVLLGQMYCSDLFLGDLNIGKHHNDHYLFLTRQAAQVYLDSLI